MKRFFLLCVFVVWVASVNSQITLSGTSYTQNFDGVGTALPAGFTVRSGATSLALGSSQTFAIAATPWNTTSGAFYNMASADGLTSGVSSGIQAASTDRVIGLRQSNGFADGSAAFVMQLANTTGFNSFSLSFKLQSLDVTAPRVSTWVVDYGFGATPASFTPVATSPVTLTTGGSSFSSTTVTVNFGSALDNNGQPVWIRVVNLTATTGSGTRPVTGIDDLSLNYSNSSSCTPPVTQATSASVSGISNTSMNISWTNGSGTNSLVVVKAGSAITGTPVSGTAYTANSVFGSGQTIAAGEYAVYNSTGNSVTVTGLTAGTTYHAAVYSFNTADNCYNVISPATANATTTGGGGCPEPTVQAGTITVNASVVSATISWMAGNGDNSLVKINTVNSFTPPTDGVSYSASTAYTGGEQVIYNNTGTTTAVSGLTAGTTYYVTVYTYNACSGTPDYLTSSNTVKIFATLSNAGIPAGYYNDAAGLSCAPLKTSLFNIINTGFTHRSYDALWTIYQTGDIQPSELATGNVIWDIYSDDPNGPDPYEFTPGGDQCGTYGGEGDCYNREHSFPQSWFGGGTSAGPGTDYHHIFPTDGYVNGRHSNYPYGRVGTATYTSANGSKLGTSNWTGISGTVFEPINEYKGDVARAFLYMVTCYQNNMASWENQDPSGNIAMDGTTWPSVEPAYLSQMMNWHNLDPVSQKEVDRNNAGYGFQGNRNPFVDHPEYVEMIWGTLCSLLPVDIISFSGKYQAETVLLNWSVANADRFSRFEVERGTDGRNFAYTGTVNYNNSSSEYQFSDATPGISGNIYYRLKMIDVSGAFRYSHIVMVTVPASKATVSIYPNPVNEAMQLVFRSATAETVVVRVTDLSGRTVLNAIIPAGQTRTQLPVQHLTSGVYVLSLSSAQAATHLRFVKQ